MSGLAFWRREQEPLDVPCSQSGIHNFEGRFDTIMVDTGKGWRQENIYVRDICCECGQVAERPQTTVASQWSIANNSGHPWVELGTTSAFIDANGDRPKPHTTTKSKTSNRKRTRNSK